jgi:hypothetical protein
MNRRDHIQKEVYEVAEEADLRCLAEQARGEKR